MVKSSPVMEVSELMVKSSVALVILNLLSPTWNVVVYSTPVLVAPKA